WLLEISDFESALGVGQWNPVCLRFSGAAVGYAPRRKSIHRGTAERALSGGGGFPCTPPVRRTTNSPAHPRRSLRICSCSVLDDKPETESRERPVRRDVRRGHQPPGATWTAKFTTLKAPPDLLRVSHNACWLAFRVARSLDGSGGALGQSVVRMRGR